MLPYILAAVGGYLIGDSLKGKQYADGGKIYEVAIDEGKLGTRTLADFESKIEAESFLREYKAKNPDSKLFIDSITSDFSTNFAEGGMNSLKGKQFAEGGMMAKGIYPLYGKKKDIVEEWQIMTDNEDEVFDNYEDAENFWYNLSDDEKDSGQFFRKVWINGKEDEVEILGGIGYMASK